MSSTAQLETQPSSAPEFATYKEFLQYIDAFYPEEQQLIIEDFIAYYFNEYRGYGVHNCQATYLDNLKHDPTKELHRLARIGFEFEKKWYDSYIQKRRKHHATVSSRQTTHCDIRE